MPFGKLKGSPLTDIPLDYLQWLEGLDNLRPRLRFAVEDELQRRAGDRQGDERMGGLPTRLPVAVEERVARDLIAAGRRALAARNHLDVGGSPDRMIVINATADHLEHLVGQVFALGSGR